MATASEILLAEGHTTDVMCEKCWRKAAGLYANGQGAYESHVEAYHAVMDEAKVDAERMSRLRC